VVYRKVVEKSEAVELVRRSVRRMKDRAQLIVDDIEVNKCEMTSQLDGAGPTCEEAEWAVTKIQASDVDLLLADKQCSSYVLAQIMDCVLLMFQRPLNTTEMDADRGCIEPSWNKAVKVRHFGHLSQLKDSCSSFFQPVQYFYVYNN